jgi:hypothetical protein
LVLAAVFLDANLTGAQEQQDPSGTADSELEILAVAEAWIQAWNERDMGSMSQLHDDDLLYYWRGRPRGYETFMGELRDYIFPNETYSVRLVDPRIQLLAASTAVVGFQMGDSEDPALEPGGAVTLVLVRRPSGWRVVHIHESPVRD